MAEKLPIVKIGGRAFPLKLSLRSYTALQQIYPDFTVDTIKSVVKDRKKMVTVLYYLADDGAMITTGKPLDVDLDWFLLSCPMNVKKYIEIQIALNEAGTLAMLVETDLEESREHEVDAVLEEIQKKSTTLPGGSSQPGD